MRIIDTNSYKTVDGFKTNIKQERTVGNHLALTSSGKYAAVIIPNSNKAALYSIEKRKLLYTTSRHKGDVESVCIDDENHYFVTGGTDGKTYVWNLLTGRMSYSFPPRSDYITDVDINSVWIVSASYDKTISVLNLTTMNTPLLLRGHNGVIVCTKLLKGMRLLSADKDGYIILWDLKTSKMIHRFNKLNDEITSLSLSDDEKFLFVGTRLGYISLYELEKQVLLKKNYLKLDSKITALCFLDDELVVGTKSGKLNFYPLLLDEGKLLSLLKSKSYDLLYKAFEDNPLLSYSNVYASLEKIFKDSMVKAALMLEQGQNENAKTVLEAFSGIRIKQAHIQNLFSDYKEFAKFKAYVEQKRYSLAYPLAHQFKHFKESAYYIAMENEWHLSFNKAKSLAMNKDGDEKVRKILSNFKGISSKSTLIQQLLQQRTAYMLFQKKLAQKDFVALTTLVKKHPFVKEFDEYDTFMEYADNIFINAQNSMEKENYSKAVKYAKELLNFHEFKTDALGIIEEATILEKFMKAFDDEDMNVMYEMIGKYPYLIELREAKALESDWNYHLLLAQKYASKADVLNAASSLEDFFQIKSKYMSISIVMQEAYIMQLYRAVRSEKPVNVIENAIKQYLLFFGVNDHIEHFCEGFRKKHTTLIDLNTLKKADKAFRPTMIIEDIIKR